MYYKDSYLVDHIRSMYVIRGYECCSKMSKFVILQIRSNAKILKKWFGANVSSDSGRYIRSVFIWIA